MKYFDFSDPRKVMALTSLALLIIASQAACDPTVDQSTSDFLSGLATDAVNQAINFAVSFARNALAAFLL